MSRFFGSVTEFIEFQVRIGGIERSERSEGGVRRRREAAESMPGGGQLGIFEN